MELMRDGQPISLTGKEFKILKFMMQNPERLISREELLRDVWGYQIYRHTPTVDNYMLRAAT
jgi:DNA-binding response OmpR family regulator